MWKNKCETWKKEDNFKKKEYKLIKYYYNVQRLLEIKNWFFKSKIKNDNNLLKSLKMKDNPNSLIQK